ncbi:SDR family NAD(P)-dependent oxidoreductase [SAR202 cluster bacterium AD-802-E10_MRT_200m]|nr:SDR family NAD(P)-dependent oxidoreductase [SAR202 cluster bacterium AD-802-E10_MRT_200m]MQF82775.1 SDR family NAD(P)-dependent oxidoreductase [SAR202 cluster bacterium AD-802-E10_MRT_200m]
MLLAGKKILVTGGSRGIGLEICRIFQEAGADVLAVSQSAENLFKARQLLPGLNTFVANVSNVEDIQDALDWVTSQWGLLDVLVNNAGVALEEHIDIDHQSIAAFTKTMEVNVTGPYLFVKQSLANLLLSDDPRIINISSNLGIFSTRLKSGYDVSKVSLNALTIALATHLKGRIAVNALSPGWVKTDMSPEATGDARTSAEKALKLLLEPKEVTGRFFGLNGEMNWCEF